MYTPRLNHFGHRPKPADWLAKVERLGQALKPWAEILRILWLLWS